MCSQASPTRWIHQIGHPLASRVKVPGSKSITNRALIVSALARGNTVLHNALLSDDTEYLSNALSASGRSDISATTNYSWGLNSKLIH